MRSTAAWTDLVCYYVDKLSANFIDSVSLQGSHGNDWPELVLLHEQPYQGTGHHGQSDPGELLQ